MLWYNMSAAGGSKWSSGFMGIALAVNLCASVSLYGFDFGSGYYFPKEHRKKDNKVRSPLPPTYFSLPHLPSSLNNANGSTGGCGYDAMGKGLALSMESCLTLTHSLFVVNRA
jgi:hypothetical protein